MSTATLTTNHGDIVAAITGAAGLDGEAVRNVRLLDRFAFLEVPAGDVGEILAKVNGTQVRGQELKFEEAKG